MESKIEKKEIINRFPMNGREYEKSVLKVYLTNTSSRFRVLTALHLLNKF